MKLKELKTKLNELPEELEECDVCFTSQDSEGLNHVEKVSESEWDEESYADIIEQDGTITKKFVCLSDGDL